MYPARKNTNINKHKFFHPGTAKNQAKLWASEEKEREAQKELSEKGKAIEAERREMDQIQQLAPEKLSAFQLGWMYGEVKKDEAQLGAEIDPDQIPDRIKREALAITEKGKLIQKQYRETVKKRIAISEEAAKSKEDPMAFFTKSKKAKRAR